MAKHAHLSADFSLLETFWREPVERTVLSNGLTVILKPDRSAALASVHFARKAGIAESTYGDIRVAVFKTVSPGATVADHVALSGELVRPYMLGVPKHFDAAALRRVLEGNPITRGLLDVCPAEYERW